MKILFLTKDLADNSLGRTHVLWTLAQSLGWESHVVAPIGARVWGPLEGSEFSQACEIIADNDRLAEFTKSFDLVIAVKPHAGSFGRARHLATSAPVLVDVDDPDLESLLSEGHMLKALAKSLLRPRQFWTARALRRALALYSTTVSNPVLQSRYGGRIIPHARVDSGPGAAHTSDEPRVVFVGTNRRHKGLNVLRDAIKVQAQFGVTLTVTDVKPRDALRHETWVGQTSLEQGLELVRSGDIVVIPSMPNEVHSLAQLPAKLIDAMIAGRAIIAADFAPLRWALGSAGLFFRAGDASELAERINELRDPNVRRRLGSAARERALAMFTVESLRLEFQRACVCAVDLTR